MTARAMAESSANSSLLRYGSLVARVGGVGCAGSGVPMTESSAASSLLRHDSLVARVAVLL